MNLGPGDLPDARQSTAHPPQSTDEALWNQLRAWLSPGRLRSGALSQELLDKAKETENADVRLL